MIHKAIETRLVLCKINKILSWVKINDEVKGDEIWDVQIIFQTRPKT